MDSHYLRINYSLLKQHHETNLPLDAEDDSFTNERVQMVRGTWVMVVTQCPHPSLTYLINKLPEA